MLGHVANIKKMYVYFQRQRKASYLELCEKLVEAEAVDEIAASTSVIQAFDNVSAGKRKRKSLFHFTFTRAPQPC